MREIALGIGRGVISSSTIHNMFRGPRVPRWSFLELVVEELHGDITEFRILWQSARLEENRLELQENRLEPPQIGLPDASPVSGQLVDPVGADPSRRIWSADIPARNPTFTGRVAVLETLHANLVVRGRERECGCR
jgi:hypothetical protein